MAEETRRKTVAAGRFLASPRQPLRLGRWLMVTVLMAWDGLLLYMIVECLIDPVYGAAFIGAVSIYLGFLL